MSYEMGGNNTRNNFKDKYQILRDLSIQEYFEKSDQINNKKHLVHFSSKFYLSNYFMHLIISFIVLLIQRSSFPGPS